MLTAFQDCRYCKPDRLVLMQIALSIGSELESRKIDYERLEALYSRGALCARCIRGEKGK